MKKKKKNKWKKKKEKEISLEIRLRFDSTPISIPTTTTSLQPTLHQYQTTSLQPTPKVETTLSNQLIDKSSIINRLFVGWFLHFFFSLFCCWWIWNQQQKDLQATKNLFFFFFDILWCFWIKEYYTMTNKQASKQSNKRIKTNNSNKIKRTTKKSGRLRLFVFCSLQ